MMQIVYKIDSMNDREGGLLEVPLDRRLKRYHIFSILEGRSAILVNADNDEETLKTSKVERVFIFNNSVNIVTANTEYWLKPAIEGV